MNTLRGDFERLSTLHESLLALDGPARAHALDELGRTDPQAAAELAPLLAATVTVDVEDRIRALASFPEAQPGEFVGPYRLLDVIGEGGFGIVHVAEQTRPVHRLVALKVIKPGMDTRTVLTRFRHEIQALSALDHPGIPAVLDAGETPDHRPFVVMPLVPGASITRFCRDQKLDVRGKVRLVFEACRAIQHAHARGVIHRDLKPDNILVSISEGVPRPAIIDFGLAKALAPLFDGATAVTMADHMVGTPEYMAPEQVDRPGDVDARADVYSMGVILHELLAGSPPFPGAELRAAGREGLRRILTEREPPRPSTLAAVPRELDWICGRCLEKSPDRRYPTIDALAEDLARFLDGRDVAAGPVGGVYRLWRRAVRHRAIVIPAGIALTGIIVAAVIAVTAAVRSAQAAERASTLSRLTREILTSVDPRVAQGRDPELLLMMLDRSLPIFERKDLTPEVECSLRETFALAYRSAGLLPSVIVHARRADDLIVGLEGRDSLRRLPMLEAIFASWKNEINPSPTRPTLEQVHDELLRVAATDPAPGSRRLLDARVRLGRLIPPSIEASRAMLADARARLGDRDPTTVLALRTLAKSLIDHRGEGFNELLTEARRLAIEAMGPDDPLVHEAINLETFAITRFDFSYEKQQASVAFNRLHLADAERVLGWRHPSLSAARLN
ncbi:MAG: Serine/threonine-protein kinase PknB, partial [Planctomycetota bacterium]